MSTTRVATLALFLVLPLSAAAAQTEGWTVRMRTVTDSGTGPSQATTVTFRMAGHRIRTELDQMPGAAAMLAGTYMLAADNDSTVWTIMPSQHMAMLMDPTGTMFSVRPRFDVVESKVDRLENLGDGGVILGHATRHTRLTHSSTTKIALGTDSCFRHSITTSEIWLAPDVDLAGVFLAAASMGRFGAGENNSLDALLKARPDAFPKGASMRSVSTTSGGTDNAKVKRTVEITEMTRGPLDSAMFVVPSGYQTMDMRAMMSSVPREAMESSMRDAMGKMMKAMCDAPKSP